MGIPTGTDFRFECPVGEVVIGFEGYANDLEDNLARIRAVCGSLALAPNGDAFLTRGSTGAFVGSQPIGSLLTVLCAQNEVAIGFVPTTNTYVSGFQWICQQVSHTGGALQFAASRSVSFGPSIGTEEADQRCPPNQVVSEVFGTTGLLVDSMGLGCSPISAVLCGDGVLVAPETCDDGNLARHDGCGPLCQLE